MIAFKPETRIEATINMNLTKRHSTLLCLNGNNLTEHWKTEFEFDKTNNVIDVINIVRSAQGNDITTIQCRRILMFFISIPLIFEFNLFSGLQFDCFGIILIENVCITLTLLLIFDIAYAIPNIFLTADYFVIIICCMFSLEDSNIYIIVMYQHFHG